MEIQILLLSSGGIVQTDYKEDIVEGKSVNDIFTNFLQKGEDGMPVMLRPGDHIVINKIPKETTI